MPEKGAALAEPTTAQFAAARDLLHKAIGQHAFPGAAWGVRHQGKVVALEALGRFTYEPDAAPVLPGTVFDLASVSKVVATSAAAMLLADRGLFLLDARLGDILPGFVIGMEPGSGKERVTLRMLLAHTSGVVGYAPLFRTCTSPDALLRTILQMPLESRPGEKTEYSDFGYILLGKVIEVLTGQPLDVFCSREIFAPLGLPATCFLPPETWKTAIPPTEDDQTFRHRVIHGEVQDEHAFVLGGVAGHAGLFANVEDLLRFAQCILDEGRTAGGQTLFEPRTIEQFATRQGSGRALGWDVPTENSSSGRYFGPRSIGHLGYAGTSLWIDRDRQLAIALLTNRTWPDRQNEAIRQIRPPFHDAIVEALGVV
ncbi:MAG TPA: serine hydrolase domain-containing protein [Acidobacteriaceae bacterium]|jgi:CubicO group peptidase (beta-lactamase class C family)|nr:serine hydrolase domain-containing protein [Acidobacteriaceae bacterium]